VLVLIGNAKELPKYCKLLHTALKSVCTNIFAVNGLGTNEIGGIIAPTDKHIMAEAPIPNVVAMLVCDQIITEQGTNKKTLIGVFDNFMSPNFPALIPRIAVYVKLADAEGDYLFKLRFVNLKDESLVAEIGIQAKCADRTQHSELALNFGGLPIPSEGKYEFQLYAGDEYLHRVTMLAVKTQVPPGGMP
jgi:hypothetical protein